MSPEQAEDVVRLVIRKNIGDEVAALPLTSELLCDLGFDELDFVETVMGVERELARPDGHGGCGVLVAIPDEDMHTWETLQDVVNTVVKVTHSP